MNWISKKNFKEEAAKEVEKLTPNQTVLCSNISPQKLLLKFFIILKNKILKIKKCHRTRDQAKNREIARRKLCDLVDKFLNGDQSRLEILKRKKLQKIAAKRRKQIRSGKYPNMKNMKE